MTPLCVDSQEALQGSLSVEEGVRAQQTAAAARPRGQRSFPDMCTNPSRLLWLNGLCVVLTGRGENQTNAQKVSATGATQDY